MGLLFKPINSRISFYLPLSAMPDVPALLIAQTRPSPVCKPSFPGHLLPQNLVSTQPWAGATCRGRERHLSRRMGGSDRGFYHHRRQERCSVQQFMRQYRVAERILIQRLEGRALSPGAVYVGRKGADEL